MRSTLIACWITAIGLCGPAFGQNAAVAPEIYTLTLRDGSTVAGAILSDRGDLLTLELDTPWRPETRPIARRDIASGPELEREGARTARYRQAGYERVQTPAGLLFVHRDERRLAKRAQEMADAVAQKRAPRVSVDEIGATSLLAPEAPSPRGPANSWLALYWRQTAVVAGALALAAVIIKTLLA